MNIRVLAPRTLIAVAIISAGGLTVSRAATGINATNSSGSNPKSIVCSNAKSCLTARNNGHGSALLGTSTYSERKERGPLTVDRAGVYGNDVSTNVFNSNAGVFGTSLTGWGVAGTTAFNSPSEAGAAGVFASETSTTMNDNLALYATSNLNSGAFAITSSNRSPSEGSAVGVEGFDLSTTESNNVGAAGFSAHNVGVFAGSSGSGSAATALYLENSGGGPLIQGYGATSKVLSLDDAGNMVLAGTLTQNGMPSTALHTSTGHDVIAYSAQQSTATVEDVGEGQVVAGRAEVRLDPTFASAIDHKAPYLVFLTAQGDSGGLYVAQKSATDFVVREHGAGTNILFDYRIVARPFASLAQRMPRAKPVIDASLGFDPVALHKHSRLSHFRGPKQPLR